MFKSRSKDFKLAMSHLKVSLAFIELIFLHLTLHCDIYNVFRSSFKCFRVVLRSDL